MKKRMSDGSNGKGSKWKKVCGGILTAGIVTGLAGSVLMGCGSAQDTSETAGAEVEQLSQNGLDSFDVKESAKAMQNSDELDTEADSQTTLNTKSVGESEGTAEDGSAADADNVTQAEEGSTRKLITTVNLDAETTTFDESCKEIENWTQELGGYVESSSIYSAGDYYSSDYMDDLYYATYTVRIPEENLDKFLSNMNGNTNVTSSSKSVEDVTLDYNDIAARKEALETEEAALEKLMKKATTMEDIMAIQSQITNVQSELNEIGSRLRLYDNQISYSTVNIELDEKKPDDLTITEPDSVLGRMQEGLTENFRSIRISFTNVLIGIVVSLPQILFCLLLILIVIALIKRGKKKRAAKKAASMQTVMAVPEQKTEERPKE